MTEQPLRLSILDFDHPSNSVAVVAEADALGYHRYWLGEHHGGMQCTNPLLLGALLAANASSLRLGSGGLCLRYHNPYRVAEDAQLMGLLLPGRFDLGVTRGMAPDSKALAALLDGAPPQFSRDYQDKLDELHGFLTGRLSMHPSAGRKAYLDSSPPMWILGLGTETARWAAVHGTGYCFSLHHAANNIQCRKALEGYRRHFVPSSAFPEPSVILVVSGICAATEREAQILYRNPDRREESQASIIAEQVVPLIGTPDFYAEKLEEIARYFSVGEIMILDLLHGNPRARIEMYSLLALHIGISSSFAATPQQT